MKHGSSDPQPHLWIWVATFGSGVLAAFGVALLIFARKIASGDIHFIPLGAPFPSVSELSRIRPRRFDRAIFGDASRDSVLHRAFDFDFAVKQTEPNVADRLLGYMQRPGIIEYDELEQGRKRLASRILPAGGAVRNFARRQLGRSDQKRDLWPVARLIVARILYQRKKRSTTKRKSDELSVKPEVKGAHFYLAFKLNLVPISYWLMLLAIGLVSPLLGDSADQRRAISAILAVLTLAWGIFTIIYNRTLIAKWKAWLADSGDRPLGNLPLFLYVPENDSRNKWEELDEYDFKVFLDDYLMDTATAFQLTVGTFMAAGYSFSRILV